MCSSFGERRRRVEIAVSLLIVLEVSLMTISCCLDRGKCQRNYSSGFSDAESGFMWLLIKNRVEGQVAYPQRQISKVNCHQEKQSEPQIQKVACTCSSVLVQELTNHGLLRPCWSLINFYSFRNLVHEDVSWKSCPRDG